MILVLLVALAQTSNQPVQASPEGFRFDYLRVKDRIEANGEAVRVVEVSVLMRTPTTVQQFGQIAVPYVSDYGEVSFERIRVQKPSGTTSDVKDGHLEDLNPFGTNDAGIPVDIRIRKLTIPKLEPGDRLSYTMTIAQKPFVPGEAYGEMKFTPVPAEAPQVYELDIPAISGLIVNVRADLGVSWEAVPGPPDRLIRRLTASLPPTVVASTGLTEAQTDILQTPDVSYTTFASWSKVSQWWWNMSHNRVRGDEATKREAERIVAGKTTPREKIEAIASFVSATVRYLNVGFGVGRMQPRQAATVLSSRFGDCKDKVGLVMAMAAAVGIEVRPVLIHSARLDLRDDTPGPQQFDHVIAAAILGQEEKDWLWMDATNSLSSPLALTPSLRDKRALVIDRQGQGAVVRTPAAPLRPSHTNTTLTGTLDTSGLLKGRVRLEVRSDAEPSVRASFASVPGEQHPEMLKAGLARTWTEARISAVRTADPADITAPFWAEFDFERDVAGVDSEKEWKLWVPDLGPVLMEASTDVTARKPVVFEVGENTLKASVELPENVAARAPLSISMERPFASLTSNYSVTGRTLKVERSFHLPAPSISRDQVPAYEALRKAASTDREQEFTIGPIKAAAPTASALQKEGKAARIRKDFPNAIELLEKAAAIDPKAAGVYLDLGLAFRDSNKHEEAVKAFTMAIEANPFDDTAYAARAHSLFELKRDGDAEKDLLKQIEVAPFKDWSYKRLAQRRTMQNRYAEAAQLWAKYVIVDSSDVDAWVALGWAHARNRDNAEAHKAWERAEEMGPRDGLGVGLGLGFSFIGDAKSAGRVAEKDLRAIAKNVNLITPANAEESFLYWCGRLSEAWALIGEAALEHNDQAKADSYLTAAWEGGLLPRAAYALGVLREKQGNAAKRRELWSVANSLGEWDRPGGLANTIEALREKPLTNEDALEIARVRFVVIPGSAKADFTEDVLVLASGGRIESVNNLSKRREEASTPVIGRLIGLRTLTPSPGTEPVRFLRRGQVNCQHGAGCSLAFDMTGTPRQPVDFGRIIITQMSPEDKSTVVVGQQVRLKVKVSYELEGSTDGSVTLGVMGAPRQPLVSPASRQTVAPGKGVANLEADFKIPEGVREIRIVVALFTGRSATKTVAHAQFSVKP